MISYSYNFKKLIREKRKKEEIIEKMIEETKREWPELEQLLISLDLPMINKLMKDVMADL